MANILVSKNRLQDYIREPLPEDKKLEEALTMHIFEVEGVEVHDFSNPGADSQTGPLSDTTFDIKVLPDRSGYAFSHRYVAQEIAAILHSTYIVPEFAPIVTTDSVGAASEVGSAENFAAESLKVEVENTELCPLYIGRKIEGVENSESPIWLKNFLTSMNQKSIGLIVDLTNFVMFDTGQPMHIFDADKVEGGVFVRNARAGETIELLDGRQISLDSSILVIADATAPLAIAGVKGGKKAEVTANTKNIILESAHYNSTYVRKTSQKLNIKNDSIKRFENAVTKERALLAMDEYCALLSREIKDAKFRNIIKAGLSDAENSVTTSTSPKKMIVKVDHINQRIGTNVTVTEMTEILKRLDFNPQSDPIETVITAANIADNEIEITIPEYRADILIQEDIADEIGRLHGYENLIGTEPKSNGSRSLLKSFVYSNKIRFAFTELGFSEVYTYTLRESGDFELANPLNIERSHLRNTVGESFSKVLELNIHNMDLLALTAVQIFEIGKVFKGKKEKLSLAIGISTREGKQKSKILENGLSAALETLAQVFGIPATEITDISKIPQTKIADGVIEIDLEALLLKAPEPTESVESYKSSQSSAETKTKTYKKFSPYPYIVRDIAVFIPGPTGRATELRDLIETIDSPMLVKIYQFDEFEKKKKDVTSSGGAETGEAEKTSYAFRMIFQSSERTLTDQEVEEVMQKINEQIMANANKGWEIR